MIRLAGVKDDTLQNWANRKIIRPFVSEPGRQGKREYSGIDLATVFIGSRLVEVGLSPASVLPFARECILQLIGEHRKPKGSFAFHQFPKDQEEASLANSIWFADDVDALVIVVVGKFGAAVPPRRHLLPRCGLGDVVDAAEPSVVIPIGAMLAKLANDAAEKGR